MVSLSGSIRNTQGTNLCGLVLANGQFVFSCSPNGTYALTVPLDGAGQITIFGFVEGHFPYKAVLTSGGTHNMTLATASVAAPSNANRDKSAQLIGGTWTYVYSILTTFADSYTFTSVSNTPDSDGDYLVTGTNSSGRPVGGLYASKHNFWAVLYQGFTIDYFYTFTFSGNNNVSGCYYQISPSGSTNLSRCYAMTGSRFPPKAHIGETEAAELLRIQEHLQVPAIPMDDDSLAVYRRLKTH